MRQRLRRFLAVLAVRTRIGGFGPSEDAEQVLVREVVLGVRQKKELPKKYRRHDSLASCDRR